MYRVILTLALLCFTPACGGAKFKAPASKKNTESENAVLKYDNSQTRAKWFAVPFVIPASGSRKGHSWSPTLISKPKVTSYKLSTYYSALISKKDD